MTRGKDLRKLANVPIGKGYLRQVGKLSVGRGFTERLQDVLEDTDHEGAAMSAEIAMAVVSSAHEAFIGMDSEGAITTWNPAAEDIFGWSAGEAVGRTVEETIVPEQHRAEFKKILERVLWSGDDSMLNKRLETTALHYEGHEVPVELTVSSFKGQDGWHFHAFLRDITERRVAESYREMQLAVAGVLAESPSVEDAVPRVIEVLSEGFGWEVGIHWGVTEDDGPLECVTFWQRPDAEHNAFEVATKDLHPPAGEGFPGLVMTEGAPLLIEDLKEEVSFLRAKPASEAGLRGAIALPLLCEAQVIGALEFYSPEPLPRDEELMQILSVVSTQLGHFIARREAEREAERMKDDFFSMVSHELRTPLTSVIGYAEMLLKKDGANLSEQGMKMVDVIRRNAKRELRLVGDLLTLVRIENGRFDVEKGSVELPQVVAQAVEAAGPAAETCGVALRVDSQPVPPFEGDPERIGQVIDNLLSNAIKFTYGATGKVTIRTHAENDLAVIEVEDTGRGISDEDQKHLFDRLYRTESAEKDHVPGTGLGLTIVKAITEAHGGQVSVHSEFGVGTTFRVEIPMRAPAAQAQPPAVPAPEVAAAPQANGTPAPAPNGAPPAEAVPITR
jgi:PAS domain S-box-containing protein